MKLIDLGGVYRMDDATSPIYGTAGYQAPEIARTGPTVPSDLFTVARTLAVLCTDFRGYRGTYRYTLPPAADVPLFVEHDSLYGFLERATAAAPEGPVPERRRDGRPARGSAPESRGDDPEVTGTGSEHLLHRRDPAGGLDGGLAQSARAARRPRRSGRGGRRHARRDGARGRGRSAGQLADRGVEIELRRVRR